MKINLKFNLKETIQKYKRVLILARKPTMDELKKISRICFMGFFVMGFISFVFYMVSAIFGA
ncbi:MAG: protein translocase SEC61 complex subunit gamma [Candidatus Aenigmarchaeota archaeon]|nr:protein translocase SEC61 complex subunit gamma [Candidatus Aenigmarchaeota archaeon]